MRRGPFRPEGPPTATDDHGSYRARCEEAERAGAVHLDSNAVDAWSYPQIIRYVARLTQGSWMVEDLVPPLSARL